MKLSLLELTISFIYIVIIYFISKNFQKSKEKEHPEYRSFTQGLIFRLIGAFIFCLIYTLYYEGGDTTAYHESAYILRKMVQRYPNEYWRIMIGERIDNFYVYFDSSTGIPHYWKDPKSFMVVRLTSIFEYLSFGFYIPATLLVAAATYSGIFKLYRLFCYYFPEISDKLRYTTLFVPSLLFWGSGILKDTYSLFATCLFVFHLHEGLILKRKPLKNITIALISAILVVKLKPYIILSIMPGALLWFSFESLKKYKNVLFKYVIAPVTFSIFLGVGLVLMSFLQGDLGPYSSLDSILQKASATQHDLKQEYNKGNAFDIGSFEPTIPGIMSKFPIATLSGLFRPFLWDAKNIVMYVSAIENSIYLVLLLFMVLKTGLFNLIKTISEMPIIFFSFIFAIFFAFSVGLTTANFGSLVRYKIPLIPFLLSGMLMAWQKSALYREQLKIQNAFQHKKVLN